MLDMYLHVTPNSYKVMIFCEETQTPLNLILHNMHLGKGLTPEFLAISPNGKMPVIIDHEPAGGGKPLSLFESGAILVYLAEKTGKFLPKEIYSRAATFQWVFWQMAGLGPMSGQNSHFTNHSEELERFFGYRQDQLSYPRERYRREVGRLYAVLDYQLTDREFVIGSEYTIADMACYPWIAAYWVMRVSLEPFPNLKRWMEAVSQRPAVVSAYARAKSLVAPVTVRTSREEYEKDFMISADTMRAAYANIDAAKRPV